MWLLSQKKGRIVVFKINLKRSVCYSRKMTSSDVPIKAEGQDRQRANTNVWGLLLFPAAFIGCSLEASDKKGSFWNWSAWKWGWPTTFELPTSENRPKSPGYMWNYKKDSKKPETTRDPDLEDRQLDFEYLVQSRFWTLGSIKILNTPIRSRPNLKARNWRVGDWQRRGGVWTLL